MGCGCGGRSSYTRATGASQRTSQHQPNTRAATVQRHAPSEQPRVVQAAALTQRRSNSAATPVRRQV